MSRELNEDMFANWVSLSCPTPKHAGLWKHEWDKHGSCSGMDRATYFQTALALHTAYNLLDALLAEGIEPDGQMYDLLTVLQVLESYIGEQPLISCSFNDEYQVYQIYEVYICLDKFQLLPCPCPNAATFKSNCWTAIALFPAFDPSIGYPSSCPVPPPGRRVSYCDDQECYMPPIRLPDALSEEQSFLLGNKTRGVLELEDQSFLLGDEIDGVLELDEVDSEEQRLLIGNNTGDVLELDEEEL